MKKMKKTKTLIVTETVRVSAGLPARKMLIDAGICVAKK